jgi:hypothetical protein
MALAELRWFNSLAAKCTALFEIVLPGIKHFCKSDVTANAKRGLAANGRVTIGLVTLRKL